MAIPDSFSNYNPDNQGDQFKAIMELDACPDNIALKIFDDEATYKLIQGNRCLFFKSPEELSETAMYLYAVVPHAMDNAVILRQGTDYVLVPPDPEIVEGLADILRDAARKWISGEVVPGKPRKKNETKPKEKPTS